MQKQVDDVVRQHVAHHTVAIQARHTVLRPSDLALERLKIKRLGLQEGRCRAAGDIIAAEDEGVDEDREAEGDACGAESARS